MGSFVAELQVYQNGPEMHDMSASLRTVIQNVPEPEFGWPAHDRSATIHGDCE